MPSSYRSIKDPGATNRMGGTQQKAFLCPYLDLTTLQDPTDYKVSTAHVPAATKGFIEVYVTKDTGKVMYDTIGGPDRHSFLAKGEFFHPGESDDIIALANLSKLERFILLLPLPGTSELLQIGTKEFQVEVKPKYDTTNNAGDGRGFTFEFECFMPDFIKYTAATIPMKPTT